MKTISPYKGSQKEEFSCFMSEEIKKCARNFILNIMKQSSDKNFKYIIQMIDWLSEQLDKEHKKGKNIHLEKRVLIESKKILEKMMDGSGYGFEFVDGSV